MKTWPAHIRQRAARNRGSQYTSLRITKITLFKMPKTDLKVLFGKRDNAIQSIQ
jgi:hypothetical protein